MYGVPTASLTVSWCTQAQDLIFQKRKFEDLRSAISNMMQTIWGEKTENYDPMQYYNECIDKALKLLDESRDLSLPAWKRQNRRERLEKSIERIFTSVHQSYVTHFKREQETYRMSVSHFEQSDAFWRKAVQEAEDLSLSSPFHAGIYEAVRETEEAMFDMFRNAAEQNQRVMIEGARKMASMRRCNEAIDRIAIRFGINSDERTSENTRSYNIAT